MPDLSDHYDKLMAQGKRAEADAFADAHPTEAGWPTGEQFDTAGQQGTEHALEQIRQGATEPQESPLSGEWADGIVPRDIARNVGFEDENTNFGDALNELADAWETSYNDTWRVHLDNLAPAQSVTDVWNSNRETAG